MNLLSTEVDVCTLSHIFSFLRYENIYRLSRVSQSWNHTISEGYFFSEVFDADQVLHELNDGWARLKQFYSKIIPVPYDRKKQAIEALEEQMLQREIMARLNNLSNLLAYMKRRHGTVKCVKEFRLFEVSLLKLGAETVVLDGIGALFPNIEVVRASFDFYNTVPVYTDSLLEELSQMENLNRIYIVCSNIEEHLEIYDQIICALNQRFKVYTVNMCESLWQRKFDLGFENDYELRCLLEKHDWLLGVHVGKDNILRRAMAANFTKSIKYILKKTPDSLWKWSSFSQTSNPLMYVMNVENKLFSKVVRQVKRLKEKSDDYLNETLSKGFYNIVDPISSLLACSKEFPPLDQQKITYTFTLFKINTVDKRLLKIQTGMSFIQYLITNNSLTDYPFIWDFVVDEDISDVYSFFNNNSLLHDMVTSNTSFEQFQKIFGRFYKDETVFLKHLMHVNYGGQTVAHYLLSDLKYENWKFSQLTLEKYQFMKERGGKDFLKLLFLENQSSVTPIELMLKCSQDHSLTDTCHLIELLVSDMIECDYEQTISIVNRMCTEERHFNLYFLVCRVIGYYPTHIPAHIFLLWKVGAQSTPLKAQYLFFFDNGFVDCQYVEPLTGKTLLHLVAEVTKVPDYLIPLLLYFGCDVNKQDHQGETCLHAVQKRSNYMDHCRGIALLLKKYGADPQKKSNSGHVAFHPWIAYRRRDTDYTMAKNIRVQLCRKCLKMFRSEPSLNAHKLRCNH